MTPANEFPGNIIFYAFLIGALGFFAYSAGVRVRWFTKANWVNRFDSDPAARSPACSRTSSATRASPASATGTRACSTR